MALEPATKTGAEMTVEAVRGFSRRLLLARSVSIGTVASMGPFVVREAHSSSGSLSLLNWDDEEPSPLIPNFEKATGIEVITTPFSENEEQIYQLQATEGEGFDLCQPTHDRAPQFRDLELLAPLDESRLALDNVLPSLAEVSEKLWRWDGKLYHTPHCWGSEAISWRTDKTTLDYRRLSYGTLWDDRYQGHVQGRPHSLLLGIGLWMDATGRLPSNRMLDAYKDEDSMRKVYDQILPFAVAHRAWIKQFWDSSNNTKSGLLENDVVIGQTWDGPAISLKKQGKPVSYMAPQEGAISWVDGWALIQTAKNVDQAYAWIQYVHSPEASAIMAEGSGYNPVVKGAAAKLPAQAKQVFCDAYPGDALQKLWARPAEPAWFAELRGHYAEKFRAA
jgi:spermidine/putrescine transport system substrate-binding protein